MPRCRKCGKKKELTEFNFRDKVRGIRQRLCRVCTRLSTMSAYYRKRDYYLRMVHAWKRQQGQKLMIFLFKYLREHGCVDCGIHDPLVLQFDHVRGKKRASVGILARRGTSLSTLITEIEKCEVRCANCHSRKTARERGYYKYLDVSIISG